jgi:hypothetical protein
MNFKNKLIILLGLTLLPLGLSLITHSVLGSYAISVAILGIFFFNEMRK